MDGKVHRTRTGRLGVGLSCETARRRMEIGAAARSVSAYGGMELPRNTGVPPGVFQREERCQEGWHHRTVIGN